MAWESIGKVTVTTAGTPVRLTVGQSVPGTRIACHAIMIQQLPGQTGRIIVGKSGMNSTTYAGCLAILATPTANLLPAANAGIADIPNGFNLADYWLDSTVNGEAALVSYLVV